MFSCKTVISIHWSFTMFRLLLLICLPLIVLATEGITPCSNGEPMPEHVSVENCERVPCILPRGDHIRTVIDFINRKYSFFSQKFWRKITQKIAATYTDTLTLKNKWREIASGIQGEFPFPSNIKEACNWLLNTQCPVYDSEDVSYNLTMPVLKLYPPNLDLDLQISLWNDDDQPAVCFHILSRTSS